MALIWGDVLDYTELNTKPKSQRAFVICPVRKLTSELREVIGAKVAELERQGVIVHWPPRDTDQTGSGLERCEQNCLAIIKADVVYIWQEGEGWLFDFGMAFAMHKPIVVWYAQDKTIEESFTNVLRAKGGIE